MGDGLRRIDLDDVEWGTVKLLVAIPREGEPWGVLAPLRGTEWGDLVQVVGGDALSHALHGWATPLVRELGVEPAVRARRVSDAAGRCRLVGACLGAGDACRPGPDVPACYEAPGLDGAASRVASTVALAWAEGRYVVVADGPGFVVA